VRPALRLSCRSPPPGRWAGAAEVLVGLIVEHLRYRPVEESHVKVVVLLAMLRESRTPWLLEAKVVVPLSTVAEATRPVAASRLEASTPGAVTGETLAFPAQ